MPTSNLTTQTSSATMRAFVTTKPWPLVLFSRVEKPLIQYGGGDATWTPDAGIYVIQIETYSNQDVDPGNDVQQVYVEVVDYLDIEIDIAWDDENFASGSQPVKALMHLLSVSNSTVPRTSLRTI